MADLNVSSCSWLVLAGSFVLGALDRDEREDFVAHLDACTRCDKEVNMLLSVVQQLDTFRSNSL